MDHVELEQVDGRLVDHKRANNPVAAARLRHEAEVLRRAVHPGVVEVVAWDDGVPARLTTAHAGTRTLERTVGIDAREAARVLAIVATTIADIHDAGVSHGALDASHVVLGPSGSVVLCGFGDGRTDAMPEHRAADVAAIGQLIEELVGEKRLPRSSPETHVRVRADPNAGCREALLSIADRIALASDDHPCPARSIARSLATLADGGPTAQLAGLRRPMAMMATLAAVAALGGGALLMGGVGDGGGARDLPVRRQPGAAADRDACPSVPTTGPDLDGDSCTDALVVEGATVRTSAGRFVLGDGDDQVLVGDWDCDGLSTAALLRRPQGEVYVFDHWSTTSTDLVTAAALIDPSVTELRSASSRRCPLLLAMHEGGGALGVPLEVDDLPVPTTEDVAP